MLKANQYTIKKIASDFDSIKITSPEASAAYARNFYGDDLEVFESMFLILLNRQNTVIGWAKISQGGICSTVCDPILVAKYAIETLSKGVILVHNHPSGNNRPSDVDKQLTEKVKVGLRLFDIQLIDHIILTASEYYSFIDNGNL